ncbi:MAG: phosphatidylglycerol lysyltransferase domain-containing protein [Spirochaetaceae bacterium]|jgi:hypothetical protein|nr:phosphatidylglycerol lysyltransferase domain-containing protein [Spirochaetaceae bacterium]
METDCVHAGIPLFSDWVELELKHKEILRPALQRTVDGVSEFTFSNLYLFRKRYNYRISSLGGGNIIISGEREGKKFFMTPMSCPGPDILQELFKTHSYWKNIPESLAEKNTGLFLESGIEISEDRDNFDYLYLREDLAKLSGKKYHKKRNLVNAFLLSYPEHSSKVFTADLTGDAFSVLELWREDKRVDGDYVASCEALELFDTLALDGAVFYVKGRPVAWCLGESLAGGKSFAVHFEKGIDEYKGIYQYINQSYAESLPETVMYINREQDLGDDGLRQAKMTYRPCGFVKKWVGIKKA